MTPSLLTIIAEIVTSLFRVATDKTLTDGEKESRLRRAGEVILSEAASDRALDEILKG